MHIITGTVQGLYQTASGSGTIMVAATEPFEAACIRAMADHPDCEYAGPESQKTVVGGATQYGFVVIGLGWTKTCVIEVETVRALDSI
jgi:hypothetical protein